MAHVATKGSDTIVVPRDRGSAVVSSDALLLRRFLSGADESAEAAFTTLIDRHGPVVHRVCVDVLRDLDEARDAAQAVFLILARRAGSIRKPEALGPWLHGVALRVARRARTEAARRRVAEKRRAEAMSQRRTPEVGPDPLGFAELHEEIDRLPEKYREPIILCYMQGQTQAEAAESLGWPLGTVQVRLHRGKDRLRSRLTRRGVGAVGLAGFGLMTSSSATAGMLGREWTEATAGAAVRFAAGRGTDSFIRPVVTELARSVLAAMLRDSWKPVALAAVVLILASSVFSLTRASPRPETASPTKAKPAPANAIAAGKPSTPRKTPTDAGKNQVAESHHQQPADAPILAAIPLAPDPSRVTVPIDRQPAETPKGGRELFERVWTKGDPRSHGGDGLGPVFNGQSCVACHHLGGPGGAGGLDRNIEVATVTEPLSQGTGYFYAFSMDFGAGRFDYRLGNAPTPSSRLRSDIDPRILGAIHPGFRDARSVVLHHFGTDSSYNAWRGSVPGPHGSLLVRTSERNPPTLFGAALIDAIPDEAIEAASKRRFPGSSVKGRVSRLKDGRIGRFGWKAQTASLKEFVLAAAAGEIGLEVPGGRQAADPRLPGIDAPGLDMDEADCDALTEYVRSLPAPIAVEPADDQESARLKSGQESFKTIGCAHCHLPKLGRVEGIYSDLLLHDMDPKLGDSDAYSVFVGGPPKAAADIPKPSGAASAREWRTPPLWGLRDSGPYLHDGRAATIDQAIALHAGQGASSARRYAELSPRRKQHLAAFLKSLGLPAKQE